MMERIALFFPSLRAGGVQRFMLSLGAGLQSYGYEVDFVLVNAVGPFLSMIPAGIRVIDLKSKGVLAALPGYIRYLKTQSPAVVISAQTHVNVIAVIANQWVKSKPRLVVSERNHLSSASKNALKWGDRFRPILTHLFYSKADAVVAVSKNVADDLANRSGLPRQSIQVVYNPYDIESIAQKASLPVDHPWFDSPDVPVFLAVGRLDPQKDYPTLLRAFSILRTKMNAHLVVLGEGRLLPELLRLTKELGIMNNVSFPGYADNPYAYMAKASVCVLSSAWEGFPNVLVEALACCTQAVSTDCPSGPFEILDGGRYGQLVPVGDYRALASAMIDAVQKPIPSDQLLARAREFTIQNTVTGYLKAAGIEMKSL
jgi:glycosyltransferase involved in cell wall biosynthesis